MLSVTTFHRNHVHNLSEYMQKVRGDLERVRATHDESHTTERQGGKTTGDTGLHKASLQRARPQGIKHSDV